MSGQRPYHTRLFGLDVSLHRLRGCWWWRCAVWPRQRRSIGPYRQRPEAIQDAARLLYSHGVEFRARRGIKITRIRKEQRR